MPRPSAIKVVMETTPVKGVPRHVNCLIDCGAEEDCVDLETVKIYDLRRSSAGTQDMLLADNKTILRGHGTSEIFLKWGTYEENVPVKVQEHAPADVVLGIPWLTRNNPSIDWAKREVLVGDTRLLTTDEFMDEWKRGDLSWMMKVTVFDSKDIVKESKISMNEKFTSLKAEFGDVFEAPTGLPPDRKSFNYRIEFCDGNGNPVAMAPYRVSQRELAAIDEQLDKLLKKGWIRPSTAAWGAPVLFAKNRTKEGGLRMVIDYRGINSQMIKNVFPLPRIDSIMDTLAGARYFTVIDLAKAFHQIRMEPGHEHYTAFTTPRGLYEYLVMPFGSVNSGAHFQAYVSAVLAGTADIPVNATRIDATAPGQLENLLRRCVCCYIDDLIVFSDTEEQHLQDVRDVLTRLRLFQLRANEFAAFGQERVEFLGFRISGGEIAPLPDKIDAIAEWPAPTATTKLKDGQRWVRSFLGAMNYYRMFIPNFGEYAAILTALTEKTATWRWTVMEQMAFVCLRDALCDATALAMPDLTKPFVIACDASQIGVGGVLMQHDDEMKALRPLAFLSRAFTKTQYNWYSYDQELYAMVLCVRKWRTYIDGRQTTLFTDHRSLLNINVTLSEHQNNKKVVRWVSELMQYNIKVVHHVNTRPLAMVPDSISRRPDFESILADIQQMPQINVTTRARRKQLIDGPTSDAGEEQNIEQAPPKQAESTNADKEPAKEVGEVTDTIQDSSYANQEDEEGLPWIDMMDIISQIRDEQAKLTEEEQLELGAMRDHNNLLRVSGRVWVPPRFTDAIVKYFHVMGGHRGIAATTRDIKRSFYWRGLNDSVAERLRQCDECTRFKPSNKRKRSALMPLAIALTPWSEIEFDFITQLPESDGCTAIGVVVCRFTKEVVLFPLRDTDDAEEIARLFVLNVWRTHGFPRRILTDMDKWFISEVWRRMMKIARVHHRLSAPFAKGTTGNVERMNRTVEEVMRFYINQNEHDDWAANLFVVEFIINSTVSEATGLSPFESSRTYRPRRGGLLDDLEERGFTPAPSAIQTFVRQRLREARERMERADRGQRARQYVPGDRVYIDKLRTEKGKTRRFDEQRIGPFVVTRQINAKTYELELPHGSRVKNAFHVDRLTPCLDASLPTVLRGLDEDGNEYIASEVEAIVGAGLVGRRNEVDSIHIKWRGYGDEYNTWQSLAEFLDDIDTNDATHVRELLQAFMIENNARLRAQDEQRLFPNGRE